MCQLKYQPLAYAMLMLHPALYRVDDLTDEVRARFTGAVTLDPVSFKPGSREEAEGHRLFLPRVLSPNEIFLLSYLIHGGKHCSAAETPLWLCSFPPLLRSHLVVLQGALNISDRTIPQPRLLQLSVEKLCREGAFLMDAGTVLRAKLQTNTSRA